MLPGGPDPDCRRYMPWDTLDAQGPAAALCTLIALRRQESALQGCEIEFLPGPHRLVRYRRGGPDGRLEVCLNAGRSPEALGAGGEALLALGWADGLLAPGGVLIRRI